MLGVNIPPTENGSLKLNSYCRLCAENNVEQVLILPNASIDVLYDRIFECTGVRLSNVPGISQRICDVCTSQLVICERFIKQCREADRKFMEWRADVESKQQLAPDTRNETKSELPEGTLNLQSEESELVVIDVLDAHQDYEQDLPDDTNVPVRANVGHASKPRTAPPKNSKCSGKKTTKGSRKVPKTQCQECGSMQQNLKQHMLIHTGEKRHVCPFCSKAFAQKGNLTHHVNQHTGHRPYKCDQCDKTYSDPQSLRSHMLVHKDERKHYCEVCGHTFKYMNSFVVHLRTHNQDKRYACGDCSRTFISSTGLKNHQRVHSGERPYSCTVCGKTFKSASNLSLHKLTHTKERRFQCGICDSRFSYKHVLKTHMEIHLRERNGASKVPTASDKTPVSSERCKKQ